MILLFSTGESHHVLDHTPAATVSPYARIKPYIRRYLVDKMFSKEDCVDKKEIQIRKKHSIQIHWRLCIVQINGNEKWLLISINLEIMFMF